MDFSFALLTNAIVAGLLLGGFYAAVTAGISISFGMLDIVNIAHHARSDAHRPAKLSTNGSSGLAMRETMAVQYSSFAPTMLYYLFANGRR